VTRWVAANCSGYSSGPPTLCERGDLVSRCVLSRCSAGQATPTAAGNTPRGLFFSTEVGSPSVIGCETRKYSRDFTSWRIDRRTNGLGSEPPKPLRHTVSAPYWVWNLPFLTEKVEGWDVGCCGATYFWRLCSLQVNLKQTASSPPPLSLSVACTPPRPEAY
jgi:hypothetical protein